MDAVKLLGSLLGNNALGSNQSNQLLNSLLSGLSGGGQPVMGRSLGGGGQSNMLAMLGGLAATALQGFMQNQPQNQSRSGLAATQSGPAAGQSPLAALAGALGLAAPAVPPTAPAQADNQALILIQAMINAAKADGQVDANEQQQIVSRLADAGPEEIEFIQREIAKPLNMDFLAGINPAMAPDIYATSLMAINLDTPAEFNYMQQLAQKLGLTAQTVSQIHQQLGIPSVSA
jgi:uncharacterized membrane protein YebE (DUF533 family)